MVGIYIIENTVNGKVYVGRSVDIEHRFAIHKSLLKKGTSHNRHLQNSQRWSEDARRKVSERRTGSKTPEYVKQKIAAANTGKPKPPRSVEHCARLSAAHLARHISNPHPRDPTTGLFLKTDNK